MIDLHFVPARTSRLRVSQVGDWVAAIGMEQYRSIFVHHSIRGTLLLELTSQQLKVGGPSVAAALQSRWAVHALVHRPLPMLLGSGFEKWHTFLICGSHVRSSKAVIFNLSGSW